MFYGSNPYRKDKPGRQRRSAAETRRVPPERLRSACGVGVAWLIGMPRRAGRRLHAMNDAESRWWRWIVSERHGGLTHQYRDARFEAPHVGPVPRGAGQAGLKSPAS